jgi:hypothetical protein
MSGLLDDHRHGLRHHRKDPGFNGIAVIGTSEETR